MSYPYLLALFFTLFIFFLAWLCAGVVVSLTRTAATRVHPKLDS